ncbi:nucleoside/nucleotide kinase family protein [Cellulomonas marina]|uniref:Phosphoribulokinase / Uridine kinase family protein n=1 Tax=Cellulomonas marina TaxID=988821 RepID=A0A1I0Y617_9CELL|nr:nucleoside/nucleotide kinase family protein [Cellulomonas marina]GIG29784.1 nucleoside/nucleotide kinase family protein [Cellulomonas marina]SFB08030.1 Phosphoribulokinase / Uridine kinase family protein [Cellulomonas marina]
MSTTVTPGLAALADRAEALVAGAAGPGRPLLGITGTPGAGKTTLATALVALLDERHGAGWAAYLPMDGFHLANTTLDRLGLRDRKGALETFDSWGFLALLRRAATETGNPVYVPGFDRRVDEGVTGATVVAPGTRLVVAEGNYLLVDQEPWAGVRDVLAACWYCDTSPDERLARLVDRHTRHGRSPEAAEAWARTVDGSNALVIEASRDRADLVVSGVDHRPLA